MAIRTTQELVEIVRTGNASSRVTQELVEIVRTGNASSRVTQLMVEVVRARQVRVPDHLPRLR